MSFAQLKYEQKLKVSLDEIWKFISMPENLNKITPESMNFKIQEKSSDGEMYPGMIISYKVSPLPGYRTTWVTEITHVKEKQYFVDEQRIGPYKMWHHEHILIPDGENVIMRDIISYKVPFGFIGSLVNRIFIKNKVNQIFQYRKKVMSELFE